MTLSCRFVGSAVSQAAYCACRSVSSATASCQRRARLRRSADRTRWVACPPGFFLPVRVLSRRFRDVFVRQLRTAFADGDLRFPGALAALADPAAFAAHLDAVARIDWVVFARRDPATAAAATADVV